MSEGISETDFWKWFNDHLKGIYASVSKNFLSFLFVSLLTISLGNGWIEIEKFGQLGTSVKFTKQGADFLLVVSCMATILLFLNLLGVLGQAVLVSMANNKNPFILITLGATGLGEEQFQRLGKIINFVGLSTIVVLGLLIIGLLLFSLMATAVGLGWA